MRDFYDQNKGAIKISIIMIVLTIIIVIINGMISDLSKVVRPVDVLKQYGADYYENHYYDNIKKSTGDSSELFIKYSTKGIKITLRDIVSMYDDVNAELFYKKGTYCDFINTYVTIYPKSPYSATDYTIKTNVSCEKNIDSDSGKTVKSDTSDGGTPSKNES